MSIPVYVKPVAIYPHRTTWDNSGGTNYVIDDRVEYDDGALHRVYVCITDNNSTTTPDNDPSNWAPAGTKEYPFMSGDDGELAHADLSESECCLRSGNGFTQWDPARSLSVSDGSTRAHVILMDGKFNLAHNEFYQLYDTDFYAENHQKTWIIQEYYDQSASGHTDEDNCPTFNNLKIAYINNNCHPDSPAIYKGCYVTDDSPWGYGSYSNLRFNDSKFTQAFNTTFKFLHSPVNMLMYNQPLSATHGYAGLDGCTFYFASSNGQYGTFFYGGGDDVNVSNCIFYVETLNYSAGGAPNYKFFRTANYKAKNNKFYFKNAGNQAGVYLSLGSPTDLGENEINVNPLFIDEESGADLRLRPSSPCIGGSGENLSKEAALEAQYPNGKWFDSNAPAGGDGSLASPYNEYGDALVSFTGDEAVVLIKEGRHDLYTGNYNGTSWSYLHDMPQAWTSGVKFIGLGKGSVFVATNNIKDYGAFWQQVGSQPNACATPFLFKDLHISLEATNGIGRGGINTRMTEVENVTVSQSAGCGVLSTSIFGYNNTADTGCYTKMTNSSFIYSLCGSATYLSIGRWNVKGCSFIDDDGPRGTGSALTSFNGNSFDSNSTIEDSIFYSASSGTTNLGLASNSLTLKNVCAYSEHDNWTYPAHPAKENCEIIDPKLVEASWPDTDARLRPDSPLIGGIKSASPFPNGSIWVANTSGTGGAGTEEDPYYFDSIDQAHTDAGPYGSIVFKNGVYDTGAGIHIFNPVFVNNSVNYYAETIGGVEFISESFGFGHSGLNVTESLNYTGFKFTSTETSFDGFVFDQSTNNSIAAHVFSSCRLYTNHSFFEGYGMTTNPGKIIFKNTHFSKQSAAQSSPPYLFEQRNGTSGNSELFLENCIVENFLSTSSGPTYIFNRMSATLKNTIILDYSNNSTGLVVEGTSNLEGLNSILHENGTDFHPNESNLAVDPLFVSPADDNWRLRPSSPLIGQG